MLIVWKSGLDQNQRKLEVGELLIKAREEYISMHDLKTWNASSKEFPRKSQSDQDIVALLANDDAQEEKIKILTAAVKNGNPKRGYLLLHDNTKNPKSAAKHNWKF